MKKIYAIVLMTLLFFSGLPLQKERIKLKLPKLAKQPIECSWLCGSMPQAKLACATYSRCYAMNGAIRFQQYLEAVMRQRSVLPTPSVNFNLNGSPERLLANNEEETYGPAVEGAEMAEAGAEPEMAAAEAIDCPKARFEGETDELKVFAAADAGVFPYGTEMRVEPVASDYALAAVNGSGGEATDALAADITFWHEGEEVQPQGEVFVQLTAKREIAGNSHHSVTIDDQGNATLIASAASQASIFNTNHFTVYGIVGQTYNDEDVEKYVRHTYSFYVDSVKVAEIIVREGDTLTVPADPAGDAKHVFAGWYKADEEGNLTDEKVESGAVTIIPARESAAEAMSVTAEDKTIYVAAKFDEQYTITLYGDAEGSRVFDVIVAENGEVEIPTPEQATANGLAVPAGQKMIGWKYPGDDGESVTGNMITVSGADIELVPTFAAAHLVHFNKVNELFKDYVIPDQTVLDGEAVVSPAIFQEGSVYNGYKFDGWYTAYDGSKENLDEAFLAENKYEFGNVLTSEDNSEFTLYAKWVPQNVQITVEVYLENANDTGYTRHAVDDSFTAEADGRIPMGDILAKYDNNKYQAVSPGYFHLNRTYEYEKEPSGVELELSDNRATYEITDSKGAVATYDVDDVTNDSYTATVNPDGSTVVRVNYSRNTYNLSFVFQNRNNINVTENNGNKTLNANGKALAPEGYENVTLPTLPIKYAQHLGKRTHDFSDSQGDMFDAFLGTAPWYFNKDEFGSGQAVFNSTNMTYPVRPDDTSIGEGGTFYCYVYGKNGQKSYPIERRYYTSAYTWQDILDNVPTAEDYTTEETAITYDLDHPHLFQIGAWAGGYKLVAVTGYAKYAPKNSTGYQYGSGPLADNTEYNFKWVNGNIAGAPCDVPIVLHYMPLSYSITFRQTERPGYVNGRGIAVEHRADDISSEKTFYFGEALNIEQVIASIDWEPNGEKWWTTIKDENGAVYSAKDGWKGDLEEDGSFPETMPARNLVFYKEWESDTYTVTVDWMYNPAGEAETLKTTQEGITYGDAVQNPAEAEETRTYASREGFVLTGWKAFEGTADGAKAADTTLYDSFSFNTPVTQHLYLEAQWAPVGGYNVVYRAGAHGTINGGTEVTDPQKYAPSAKAPVKYIAVPEEGWVFTGWAIGETLPKSSIDGTPVYYGSGDVIHYSEDADLADGTEDSIITLVAQYEYTMGNRVDVTYHTNFPEGSGQENRDITIPNVAPWNGDFTILGPNATELGFPEAFEVGYYRYEFMGWTTTSDEKIFSDNPYYEYFYADEIVAAGKEDNHFYATWRVIELHIEVPVTKVWDDNNNQDGIRTESVTVRVLENNTEVERATLSADNDWRQIFQNLYSNRNYIVEEVTVPEHYEVAVTGDLLSGYTVTNTHTPFETSVSVSKVWDDAENRDGIRPEATQVLLYADNTAYGDTITLNGDNSWNYTWENLPQRRNGTDIAYTVKEVSVPADYTVSYAGDAATGYTVTNKHYSPVTVTLDVRKQIVGRDWFNEDLFYIELEAEDETFPMPEDASSLSDDFIVKDIVIRNNSDTVAPDTRGTAFPPITFTLDDLGGATSKTFTYYLHEESPEEERREKRIPGIFYDASTFTIDITVSQGANDSLHADVSIYGKPDRDSLVTAPVFVNRYSESEFLYSPIAEKSLVHVSTPPIQDGEFLFELRPVGANAAVAPMPSNTSGEGIYRADTVRNVGHHVNFGSIVFNHNNLRNSGFTDNQLINGVSFHYQLREVIPGGVINHDDGTKSLKREGINTYYDAVVHYRELVVRMDTTDGRHIILLDTNNAHLFPEFYPSADGSPVYVDRDSEAGLLRHRGRVPLFRNLRIADTAVTVTKEWKDYNDGLALRPTAVKVKLWADGVAKDSVLLRDDNSWTHTFTGLPFAKVNSQLGADTIRYTVTENAVTDYVTDINESAPYHYTVTNTLDSNLLKKDISIVVHKRWVSPPGTTHPDITVLLLRDGEKYDSVVLHHGETTHTFTGLPYYDVYDESGKVVIGTENLRPFAYTTAERPVSGYTTAVNATFDTITNTIMQEYTSIPGRKSWVDSAGTQRPDISIVLIRDGEAIDSVTLPHGTVLFHFRQLPVYDVLTATGDTLVSGDGHVFAYSVIERPVAGYSTEQNGYNFTNTIDQAYIDIPVTKVWDDAHDQDGYRPQSVTLRLTGTTSLPYSRTYEMVITGVGDQWDSVFKDLPVYDDARNVIRYTLSEPETPEHYSQNVSGYTVTNTHEPETVELTVYKHWKDNNNAQLLRDYVRLELRNNLGSEVIRTNVIPTLNDYGYVTWRNMPKYHNGGQLIEYYVTETPVPDQYRESYAHGGRLAEDNGYIDTITNERLIPVNVCLDVIKVLRGRQWFPEDRFFFALEPVLGNYPMPEEEGYYDDDDLPYHILVSNYSPAPSDSSRLGTFAPITFRMEDLDLQGSDRQTFTYHIRELSPAEMRDGDRLPNVSYSLSPFIVDITVMEGAHDSLVAQVVYSYHTQKGYEIVSHLVDTPRVVNTYNPNTILFQPIARKFLYSTDNEVLHDNEFTFKLSPVGKNAAIAPMPSNTLGTGAGRYRYARNTGNDVEFFRSAEDGLLFDHAALRNHFTDSVLLEGVSFEYRMEEVIPAGAVNLDNGLYKMAGDGKATYYDGIVHFRQFNVRLTGIGEDDTLHLTFDEDPIHSEFYLKANGDTVFLDRQGYLASIHHQNNVPLFLNRVVKDTTVTASKQWVDYNDNLALRPESVMVKLWADGVDIDSALLNEDNQWTHSFTGLPRARVDDEYHSIQHIAYTITENAVENYTHNISRTDMYHVTVHNTLDSSLLKKDTSITVHKRWISPADATHPDITILLLRDGVKYDSVVLQHGQLTHTFTGLPYYDIYENGKVVVRTEDLRPFTYTIDERPVRGYTKEVNASFDTITNTIAQSYTSLTGRKTWVDSAGTQHPDITIVLQRDGEDIDSVTLSHGNTSYFFLNLPLFDVITDGDTIVHADGHVFAYNIVERPVEGYSTVQELHNFINTIDQAYTEIPVTKIWDDAQNQDGYRPQSVTLRLTGTTVLPYSQTYDMVITGEGDRWDSVFKDLPVYDEARNVIRYTLSEPQTPDHYTQSVAGYTVTNKHVPELTSIPVTKVWDDTDNFDGLRPYEVTVWLVADGAFEEFVTLDEWNDFSHVFTGLPVYRNGTPISYTVMEDPVDHYETTVTGSMDEGYVITNTHVPDSIDFSVRKVWNDMLDNDGLRPSAVHVTLIEVYPEYRDIVHATVTAAENWRQTLGRWPKYSYGEEIIYSLYESPIYKYDNTGVHDDCSYGGTSCELVVHNRHIPDSIDLYAIKTWEDNDNTEHLRREVSVQLYRAAGDNNVPFDPATTSAAGSIHWTPIGSPLTLGTTDRDTVVWTKQPKAANGMNYQYAVKELDVPAGYEVSYPQGAVMSDDSDFDYVVRITNRHVEEVTTVNLPLVQKKLIGRLWLPTDTFVMALVPERTTQPMPALREVLNGIVYAPLVITMDSTFISDSVRQGGFAPITFTMDDMAGDSVKTFTYRIRELTATESGLERITGVTYAPERYVVDITVAEDDNNALQVTAVNYYALHTVDNVDTRGDAVEVPLFTNRYNDSVTVFRIVADKQLTIVGMRDTLHTGDYRFELKPVGTNAYRAPMPKHSVGSGADRVVTVVNEGNAVRFYDDEDPTDGLTFDYLTLRASGFTDEELSAGIHFEYEVREIIPEGAVFNDDGTATWTWTYTREDGTMVDELYDGVVHYRKVSVRMVVEGDKIVLRVTGGEGENSDYYLTPAGDTLRLEATVHAQRHSNGGAPIFRNGRIARVNIPVEKAWDDYRNALSTRPAQITVHLIANGTDTVATTAITADSGWRYTFMNLPATTPRGGHITYSVMEEAVPHYTVTYYDDVNTGQPFEGLFIKNTLSTYGDDEQCAIIVERDQFSECTGLPCPPSVTDLDGNTYPVAKIDGYCWMTENLRTRTAGAMAYSTAIFPDGEANVQKYGYLYTWHDAAGGTDDPQRVNGYVRGICPTGWHLPTVREINVLMTNTTEALKSDSDWVNNTGTNASGFNALPAGYFNGASGRFEALHADAWFHGDTYGNAFSLQYFCCKVLPNMESRQSAFSVRCVKDCE